MDSLDSLLQLQPLMVLEGPSSGGSLVGFLSICLPRYLHLFLLRPFATGAHGKILLKILSGCFFCEFHIWSVNIMFCIGPSGYCPDSPLGMKGFSLLGAIA